MPSSPTTAPQPSNLNIRDYAAKGRRRSLEAEVAVLRDYAANLRLAATRAREAANNAAAQQQISFEVPYCQPQSVTAAVGTVEGTSFNENIKTTLMCKNVPNDYSRDMFIAVLDSEGLAGLYDFVYLPRDFKKKAAFGYAFVNFQGHEQTLLGMQRLQGFKEWKVPSRKVLQVVWSSPHQGLDEHMERYRNSPVMHDLMPDEYKPILLKGGIRIEFPRPTARMRAPHHQCNQVYHLCN